MIPTVVFTSSDEESDRLGGNADVVKPIRYEEFLEAIRSIGVFRAVINREGRGEREERRVKKQQPVARGKLPSPLFPRPFIQALRRCET